MTATLDPTQSGWLAGVQALLFDIDGVLHRGWHPLPGAEALPATLDRLGISYLCITNNASRTPEQVAEAFASIDIPIPASRIMTSAQATNLLLRKRLPAGTHLYAIGMRGLYEPLFDDGYFLLDERQPAYVVVGADFELTYGKLKTACLAIRAGASFIATNPDTTFPTPEGLIPGCGAILAALVASTGVKPEVVGKPAPALFHAALERLGVTPEQAAMVGDRLDTDITGAQTAGLRAIFVGTGVNSLAEAAAWSPPADLMLPGLPELLQALEQRRAGLAPATGAADGR